MADVQVEDGHVRVANHLYWAVLAAPFNDSQRRVLFMLIGLTYGWSRKTVELSTADLASQLGVDATGHFRTSLSELIREGVVRQLEQGSGLRKSVWMVNKDFEQWGRFALAQAFLVAKWGARPKHRDELAAVDKGSTEGASEDAPSSLEGGLKTGTLPEGGHPAQEQAPCLPTGTPPENGHPARTQARPKTGTLPVHRQVPRPYTGTPTGSKSRSETTYSAGETGEPEQLQQRSRALGWKDRRDLSENGAPDGDPREPWDPTQHSRWSVLTAKFVSDAERDAIAEFLTRAGTTDGPRLLPRLINWCDLEMVPAVVKAKLSPTILAAALLEYKGDFNGNHVWAFVEGTIARFERSEIRWRGEPVSLQARAAASISVRQEAARLWRLIKREGLINAQFDLARQRVALLVGSGQVADVDEFMAFLKALPQRDLASARSDHFAEGLVADTLLEFPRLRVTVAA